MKSAPLALFAILFFQGMTPAWADNPSGEFRPDPRSVRRHGPAYRYPQAGWIVLHIEGEPYERGYQHGQLLASEIASYTRCFAAMLSPKSPAEGWKLTRTLVNALFVRKFDKEFLEEMKGIADGASAAGAKFGDRSIDLIDIVALNCWAELETLDSALEATPNGLEGVHFPRQQPKLTPPPKPMHCSAFAATGSATRDGKIVFGHVTMFDLYPSLHFNVWLDVKPTNGHRILMQSYPGGIQSGMDYYQNDAGLLMLETTISQTRFNIHGLTVASRTRKAMQYSDSIDKAVEFLQKDNNGLYTNEWMLGDIKTNEIAMFELGTNKSKLYRSSKNEWFGGTEGFYWGCNNVKDINVRLETVASVEGRPVNLVWKPADRDRRWLELYNRYKGKIDVEFGKLAFTTPPLCSAITIDAKFTTTDLARNLMSWGLWGPPRGRSWMPTDEDKQNFPEIRPLVSNPWTLLNGKAPPQEEVKGPQVVDLPDKIAGAEGSGKEDRRVSILRGDEKSATLAAWHGTLLPRTDGDIWLASAFADYEKWVAVETTLEAQAKDGTLSTAERDRLAVDLFAHRSSYLAAARSNGDVPLSKIRAEVGRDEWHRIAAGKGVLVLHELRQVLGKKAFQEMMEAFGRENAGKEVASAQFQAHAEKAGGQKLQGFFDYWLNQTGLPSYALTDVLQNETGKGPDHPPLRLVSGLIRREKRFLESAVEIVVETADGENSTKTSVAANGVEAAFKTELKSVPRRVVLDKYGLTAKANGGVYSVLSWDQEIEKTLIVYATGDEEAAARETATALQESIRTTWSNMTVPIKADKDTTDDDLKTHHVLLIGRPDSNAVIRRFAAMLPITFGPRSFVVRNEAFAHAGSGVLAAAENPLNTRFSLVVLAGLSAEATTKLPAVLMKKDQAHAEVIVVPNGEQPKALIVPAKELMKELEEK